MSMVILGMGSNIGDRLAHLRKALHAIKNCIGISVLQVSPVYISDALLPENAPADWDMPYLNLAIRCDTSLAPLDLLRELKKIEHSIGRKPAIRHWGPRIVDIDILAFDNDIIQSDILTVPHESLQQRPFALWPLADVAPFWRFPLTGANHDKTAAEMVEPWGSRFSGEAPFHTRQINQRIDTPELVGILNITPDSFSDGGKFSTTDQAVQHALSLVADGADIIDIGAESTAPNAPSLTPQDEWARLKPVLQGILATKHQFVIPPKISIDTYHAETAANALLLGGVDWINDVSGLKDPQMRDIIKSNHVDCVMMHHLSLPASRQHVIPRTQNAVEVVYDWGRRQLDLLMNEGFSLEKIIFDPGIGFGKTPEQSQILIKHIDVFKKLRVRLLAGHSRKSFFSLLTASPSNGRDIETLSASLYLARQPVDYLRIHNVDITARAFKVWCALC